MVGGFLARFGGGPQGTLKEFVGTPGDPNPRGTDDAIIESYHDPHVDADEHLRAKLSEPSVDVGPRSRWFSRFRILKIYPHLG